MESNGSWVESTAATDFWPSTATPAATAPRWIDAFAAFFYTARSNATLNSQHTPEPDLYVQSWPYLLGLLAVEQLALAVQGRRGARLNATLSSLAAALLQESLRLSWRGGELCAYAWLHARLAPPHLDALDWTRPTNFLAAAILVDLCYYWLHRACHEVHILWAQHQVHHSSEELSVAVGARQSALQGWCGALAYLPLAPLLPPRQLLLHQQISLLYQLLLHTEAVGSLGPLEYLFNTPNHHRVHHGCNKKCLDKNYGGFLIIWDRLFGTFAEEIDRENIVYGLVYNQPSFNPIHLQTFYNKYVWHRMRECRGWRNKMAAIFYGPSWAPGAPRLGHDHDKIQVERREMYDVRVPAWLSAYVALQLAWTARGLLAARASADERAWGGAAWAARALWALAAGGLLLEGRRRGAAAEGARVAAEAALPGVAAAARLAGLLAAACWAAAAAGLLPLRLPRTPPATTATTETIATTAPASSESLLKVQHAF